MTQVNRLSSGGQLNRNKPLRFRYDGVEYIGFEGDTLASALLANGVILCARSFKYHRPRGIMSAGLEEANATVQLEQGAYTQPNSKATTIALYDGLEAHSQNCWPSVTFDVGAVNQLVGRFLPAGFYYKTFMWPKKGWVSFYEKQIRKAAGMGHSPLESDPDRYEHLHTHVELVIVGAGPAGIAAALTAAQSKQRVLLVDDKAQLGGSLLSRNLAEHPELAQWLSDSCAALEAADNVTVLTRTLVQAYHDYNYLLAAEYVTDHLGPGKGGNKPRQRLWKIRAKQVILATGAIERPIVFADNDRPGVMLASAISSYIHRFGVLPERKVVLFTNNDSAYRVALDVLDAGGEVTVIDARDSLSGELSQAARDRGARIIENSVVSGVYYSVKGGLSAVEVCALNADGTEVVGAMQTVSCRLVGTAGGWTPNVSLFSQARGKLAYLDDQTMLVPSKAHVTSPSQSVGACCGELSTQAALTQGQNAAIQALQTLGETLKATALPSVSEPVEQAIRPLWIAPTDHPIGEGPKKHFHELQNDAQVSDIWLSKREGFESVEHLKRYTNTGRGTDQGKTSNVNALAIMAQARGVSIAEVGVTTFRPPYDPMAFGLVAGQNARETFLPKRTTPMHEWSVAQGAVFEDVGDWKRAWYYPQAGEDMHQAVLRESKAVRDSVGIFDASTLGKIDIQGKDAAKLLNMLYTNAWLKLGVGRCRYGLMCNEHGMVFDDGVTTRLAENHFHMTTTTGGAGRVMDWIEEWVQTEWPDWEVFCTSVTEQWAVIALNGPNARKVLEKLTDADISNETLPFMGYASVDLAGVPARLFRISFTGEQAFEINVPARYGQYVWEQLFAAGKDFDICPYGTETMHVLRAEKGFIIAGQDTDGTVTPHDLGMSWAVKKNGDNLGRRSWSRSDTAKAGRKQLVGLLTQDPQCVLPEGAHIVEQVLPKPPMKTLGHVTSSYMSPNVEGGRSIAMALIHDGLNRMGESVDLSLIDGTHVKATIVSPVFVDPEGARSRV